MDIKNITGSLYTDWRLLSRQCPTDASVSKSYLQDVKKRKAKVIRTEVPCGQGCLSQPCVGTSQWMNGLKEWKHTSHNRGTVHRTTTQLCPLTGVNLAHGLQKLQGNFIQRDISSLWTTPKAKSQTVQPNTSRVTLWC